VKTLALAIILFAFFGSASALPVMIPPNTIEANAVPSARSVPTNVQGLIVTMTVIGCNVDENVIEGVFKEQINRMNRAFNREGIVMETEIFPINSSGAPTNAELCSEDLLSSTTNDALVNFTNQINTTYSRWRADAGLDIVVLYRPSAPNSTACGMAWQNNQLDAGYAYGVVDSCPTSNAKFTLAHVLGHVFGAAHGPKVDGTKGVYSFSQSFVGRNKDGKKVHSLMSYGKGKSKLIPRFSSPSNTNGKAKFNNGKTIRLTAPVVAGFRETISDDFEDFKAKF
jgi:hypothetical protein